MTPSTSFGWIRVLPLALLLILLPATRASDRVFLEPVSCCDGEVFTPTASGEQVWQNSPGSAYFYFQAPGAFEVTPGAPVYLAITYWDQGEGTLGVQYDSDRGDDIPAIYFPSESHTRSSRVNTGAFATSYHELQRPRFARRQNGGSDFRVTWVSPVEPLRVKSVQLSNDPFPDAQFQRVLTRPWLAPYSGPSRSDVDRSTLRNKVMTGYQGWFRAPNDLDDRGWDHWCREGVMKPETFHVDQWPDLSEYCGHELFRAGEVLTQSGKPAHLFSSTTPETVHRHFQWMRKYQIDGAFLQRFVNEANSGAFGRPEWVLANVRAAAHQEGRIWAIEYDVSALLEADAYRVLTTDWKWLVDVVRIREDARYAHETGMPVVFVWGLPFPHNGYSTATADAIIDFLKNDPVYGGNYVMGGIPWWWQRSDLAEWSEHIQKYHGVLTWMPDDLGYQQDKTALDALGIDYFAHVWPGFSWAHLQREAPGTDFFLPRSGGEFFWNRIEGALGNGAQRLFVGMFDEYDESTAVMPMTDDPPHPAPDWGRFITNDGRPSDWWMALSGAARETLAGQRELAAGMPQELELANRSNLGLEAWTDLGTEDAGHRLARREVADGRTSPSVAGGRDCRTNLDPDSDFYVYFAVDPSFADAAATGLDATIEVEYHDAIAGAELTLEYDGLSSPYTLHPKRALTQGTDQWRTVRFEIADAFLGGRQNGESDFRVRFVRPLRVSIDRVWVRLEQRGAVLSCPADIEIACDAAPLIPVHYPAPVLAAPCLSDYTFKFTPPSGSGFPAGTHTVLCLMQDRAGNETSCTFQVIRAPLGFTGFFPPVNGADASGGSFESPVKTFRLGSTIPLKFRAHCGGSPVTIGEHTLEAAKFSSSSSAEEPIDATPADGASTENRFRHAGNGEWHYNLDTRQSGMSRGVWQLVATLSDGSRHAVWVQLK